MKRFVYVLMVIALLLGCSGRREQMSALLDRADSLNRAYVPMTGGLDSLLLEAADYYDHHGTPNEQMRAHYLLGCAYRDMGEAPQALQCYQDAVDCADTLASDCDYRRLMSVYGQMASLFHAQNLPEDEIAVCDKYGQLALKIQDTLLYIREKELLVKPYYILGDTTSVLHIIENVRQLYERYGYHQEAVASNGLAINIALNRGQYAYAYELMRELEEESGLFQDNGDIVKGREIYYDFKGRYFIGINQLDSAEYFMRELGGYNRHLKSAYRGLLAIYQQKRNTDSIVKYSRLYEDAVDSHNNTMRTEVVHQMSSMYNYQRFQHETAIETEKARRMRQTLYAVLCLIVIVAAVCWYMVRRYREREKAKVQKLLADYVQAQSDYQRLNREYDSLKAENDGLVKACNELKHLKQDNEELKTSRAQMLDNLTSLQQDKDQQLSQKETEINILRVKLEHNEKELKKIHVYDQFHVFVSSNIVRKIKEKSDPQSSLRATLSDGECRQLIKQFRNDMPLASAALTKHTLLTYKEWCVCILVLLDFRHDEIMRLMQTSSQSLTNYKANINRKLFKMESASSFQSNLKTAILMEMPRDVK